MRGRGVDDVRIVGGKKIRDDIRQALDNACAYEKNETLLTIADST